MLVQRGEIQTVIQLGDLPQDHGEKISPQGERSSCSTKRSSAALRADDPGCDESSLWEQFVFYALSLWASNLVVNLCKAGIVLIVLCPLPFPPFAFRAMVTAAAIIDALCAHNWEVSKENIFVPLPFKMADSTGTLTGTTVPLRRLDSYHFGPKHLPRSASHESWEGYLNIIAWHPWDESLQGHCLDEEVTSRNGGTPISREEFMKHIL